MVMSNNLAAILAQKNQRERQKFLGRQRALGMLQQLGMQRQQEQFAREQAEQERKYQQERDQQKAEFEREKFLWQQKERALQQQETTQAQKRKEYLTFAQTVDDPEKFDFKALAEQVGVGPGMVPIGKQVSAIAAATRRQQAEESQAKEDYNKARSEYYKASALNATSGGAVSATSRFIQGETTKRQKTELEERKERAAREAAMKKQEEANKWIGEHADDPPAFIVSNRPYAVEFADNAVAANKGYWIFALIDEAKKAGDEPLVQELQKRLAWWKQNQSLIPTFSALQGKERFLPTLRAAQASGPQISDFNALENK